MKKLLAGVSILYCISCNTNSGRPVAAANSTAATNKPDTASVIGCYSYMQDKDTILLSISTSGSTFIGQMLYQLREKDRNRGTLQGIIKGDTLIADYTFQSEGMTSVRQVAFIKQQNSLREGFGELVLDKNNQYRFKNSQALMFTGFILTPFNCE